MPSSHATVRATARAKCAPCGCCARRSTSPESIATLVRRRAAIGFNTLLVQVRGRGDAYFNGGLEPRAAELQRQPATSIRSAIVLAAAHAPALRVHAWVNVNLVSSAVDLPTAPTHIVHRHPEWLMVPRDLAPGSARADPADSPAYVGTLARWTRARSRTASKGCTSRRSRPAAARSPRSRRRATSSTRYAVDGVHLDYARYPTERVRLQPRAPCARSAIAFGPQLTAPSARALDAREADDPLAYPDALSRANGRRSGSSRLTALVARLRTRSRRRARTRWSASPPRRISHEAASTAPGLGRWLQAGLVDAVCPMAYTPDSPRFAEQIAAARERRRRPAGLGRHRRLSAAAGADDRQHRDRPPARRRRHRPLLLRQPRSTPRQARPTTSPSSAARPSPPALGCAQRHPVSTPSAPVR